MFIYFYVSFYLKTIDFVFCLVFVLLLVVFVVVVVFVCFGGSFVFVWFELYRRWL